MYLFYKLTSYMPHFTNLFSTDETVCYLAIKILMAISLVAVSQHPFEPSW